MSYILEKCIIEKFKNINKNKLKRLYNNALLCDFKNILDWIHINHKHVVSPEPYLYTDKLL